MANKKSFVQRVLDKLTGGDEAKIARFQKKVSKFSANQITIRENEIEDKKEKIVDLKERYEEVLLNVDLEQIKNSDTLDSYVDSYVKKAFTVQKEIDSVEKSIEGLEAEIKQFRALAEDLA